MIATHNQPKQKKCDPQAKTHAIAPTTANNQHIPKPGQQWLPSKIITHHPKAGLNPLVDTAAYLFSAMGKLKRLKSHRHLGKLQKELTEEIDLFQDKAKMLNYNAECLLVCRYALCSSLDDIISNTAWGGQGQWEPYSLLLAYQQDMGHQEKFFAILERLIKNPALYIDLMEFMYLCLSLGFKGQYKTTEYSHHHLELTTEILYQHIRAYRGNFNKTLSPLPIKPSHLIETISTPHTQSAIAFPLLMSICAILSIFIVLGFILNNTADNIHTNLEQLIKVATYE
ncbi:MAG: hypothetical protein A3E83_04890 [Gammaproteobacteria bacterium RIFCSPHIGHO2_12_FULL_41_20]|nr:MAG: hypothetical protein A3E83_04890 [Gammaproteobacteria bacterium RIFCSPHIGHO2_12_FULL_41_20]